LIKTYGESGFAVLRDWYVVPSVWGLDMRKQGMRYIIDVAHLPCARGATDVQDTAKSVREHQKRERRGCAGIRISV
jgi:hypothetical protein